MLSAFDTERPLIAERVSVRQLLWVVFSRYAYVRTYLSVTLKNVNWECQLVTLRNVNFRHSEVSLPPCAQIRRKSGFARSQ